ncbi:MAG: amidohydrolase [Peptostreptococcaceae bacterium]|nr:amidohydrolase [Peptostreptococcaceae bacterium]
MELILYNGKIHSGKNFDTVQAIGIEGSQISMLGNNETLLKHKKEKTQCIDLKGKSVFPGFNDSHMHLLNYGYSKTMINLIGVTSIEEIQERSRRFLLENSLEKDAWIFGRGWNQDFFTGEKVFPTKYDLDKISTEHPILFPRTCGHIFVVNSKALEIMGVDKNTPQVEGGKFDVDAQGEPTGVFRENAQKLIFDKVPSPSIQQIKSMMKRAFTDLNKEGITSVGSDDFTAMPDKNYHNVIQSYQELIADGEMTVRVYEQCLLPKKELLEQFYSEGYRTGKGCDFFKIGPLKLLIDGALGARTALLKEPYSDDPTNRGIATAGQEELNELVLLAHQNNCQVAIHGIGDGGMYMVFDAIENALRISPRADHRHGIVHAQITDETLMQKFKDLQVLAYIQPIFLDYDWKMVRGRIGSKRESTSYDWKGMYDRGIHASMGSDSPVETFSVMAGIYEAVTRKDLSGNPAEGWMIDKAVTVEQALKGYTIEGAFASFEENLKGTIDIGKFADLVVLSENILEIDPNKIKDVLVDMTIVNGKIVYTR